MKSLLVSVLLIFLFSISVSAEVVIEAQGTGKTLDEAKDNARTALAEKVFPGTVIVETMTSVVDGNGGGYSSSFAQKSSYTIVGEFPGFNYKVVSSKKNSYVVSTEITGDAATLNFYGNKLDEQKADVEEFYRRYSSMSSDVSASTRRKALALVIEYYYYYNIYSNIILSLGGIPDDVDIPVTLAVLQVDYQSLLDEEQNELLTKSSVSAITQEIKEELQKNAEAQKEYIKAREEAAEQAELQRKLILDQKISDIVNNASVILYTDSDGSAGLRSFEFYLDVIREADNSFVEACREYDKLIKEQYDAIEKAFSEEAGAIRNRTYPIAHLDGNGNPTEIAKKAREKEIDELRTEKDREKEEIYSTVNEKLSSEIQKRYDYLEEAVRQFESKEFTVYSSNGETSITSIPKYDGSDFCWSFTVHINEPLSVDLKDIKLSYSTLTGTSIPKKEDKINELILSSSYIDTVETYGRLLALGEYDFSLSFKIDMLLNGQLTLKPALLDIIFADGKEVSIPLGNEYESLVSINLDNSAYLGYPWLKKGVQGKEFDKAVSETVDSSSADKAENSRRKLGLELDVQIKYLFENPFKTNIKSAADFIMEGRLFIYDFYVSVSGNMTVMDVSNLRFDKDYLLQFGVYGGVGYRLKDFCTLSCIMSYNEVIGFILNPCIAFGFDWDTVRFDAVTGVYVNCKTMRPAISLGVATGWRVF